MTDREKLIADCTLAADLMEQADTFPTGVGILRDAAKALAEAQAAQDAAVAAALKRAEGTAVSHAQKHEPFGHPAMGSDEAHIEAARMIAAAIRSLTTQPQSDALAAARAEARRVKPLVWEHHPTGWIAAPPTGQAYIIDVRIKGRVMFTKGMNPPPQFSDLEAAKAAAQADYEARIHAALAEGTA